MKSPKPGARTSGVEVTGVNLHGVWLLADGAEYFLPHEDYPWFKTAKVEDVLHVRLLHHSHLHWPNLDIDLCLESLEEPDAFPLVYK